MTQSTKPYHTVVGTTAIFKDYRARFDVVAYVSRDGRKTVYEDVQVRPVAERPDWYLAGYSIIATRPLASAERIAHKLDKDYTPGDYQ